MSSDFVQNITWNLTVESFSTDKIVAVVTKLLSISGNRDMCLCVIEHQLILSSKHHEKYFTMLVSRFFSRFCSRCLIFGSFHEVFNLPTRNYANTVYIQSVVKNSGTKRSRNFIGEEEPLIVFNAVNLLI